jgi:hypothetical protein
MPVVPPAPPISSAPSRRWLPFAVFVFFALSLVLNPQSTLRTQQLLDPDDYMRLNEVVNWLQSTHPFGAGWFDLSHPRLDPGNHAVVHWARLMDLPIALFALPLLHAFGMRSAVLIASLIVPPLLFLLLLLLTPALARPLVRKKRADLADVFLLFTPAALVNFFPGRVDHHGDQMMIGAFGLLCLTRMVLCPRGWKAAIATSIAFACGLWIGTEALPWLILFAACLALTAGWRGGFALRNAAIFGIALPLSVATIMPLALPPDQYTSRALSWFSGADLIFALLTGAVFIFGWIGGYGTNKKWLRLVLITALGGCAALLFLYLVPDALNGPFADYDDFNSTIALENIGEAQPFWPALHFHLYATGTALHAFVLFLRTIFMPCLALLIIGRNLLRASPRARMVWLMHGFFLLPALLLTLFWQVRVAWFAQIFSIAPLTWLAWHIWKKIAARGFQGRPLFWAEIIAFLLITPLPVLLLPAALGKAKLYPDLLLFPAQRPIPACPLTDASAFLNEVYGDRPRVILSGMNEGPELLFRTPHDVLAAPFNIEGNTDAFAFFNARDERKAVAVVLQRHVDLVLVCRSIPAFYAGLDNLKMRFNAYIYMDPQGHMRMTSSREHPTLIERLVDGDIPAWLKPVVIPLDPDYLLFEVHLTD